MPTLPTKSFATIVQDISAGFQGRVSALVNFAVGSTLRAIAESYAGILLWFQAMVLQLLTATRLSTASGTDVDTFAADFMPSVPGTSSPRLGAQAASGQLTFSRFTAGPSSCFIPVGSTVKSNDGSQTVAVTADPTFTAFSASLGGYTLPSSVASIVVPAQNLVPGVAGNVTAGSLSVITSDLTGIDTVTNLAAFTNGDDFESDSALKSRFAAYILGLSRGDIFGLTASIEGVEPEVQFKLTELYNYDGSYRPGYFFVVADDGSGNPDSTFMQAITTAANAVRPLGIQCGVFRPVIIWATVSMQIATAPGYDHGTVNAEVSATLATNINSLGLGNALNWSVLAAWAYSVPGVTNVQDVLLNGFSGDAASLSVTKATLDGKSTIAYATVKCRTTIVS